ncbi:MAG: hypothetical protein GWN86_08470, partial [Desulfobacterales bacterium]|nr:hypothetical protein [Desulfobacterales bacterium]
DLEARSRERYIPASFVARFYFVLGDYDTAFEYVDRAYEERDWWLCELIIAPGAEMLEVDPRQDPRFKALLKKMNLEP